MFDRLRENRSLLMGLAIAGVAFFHTPFHIEAWWLYLVHENLCCGVDLFLFFSGLGACHSIQAHGRKGYLQQRVRRILPGLYLFLVPWSICMVAIGAMSLKQFVGSVTLVGWWLGQELQLNWYFSAVWMFFLLAVLLYPWFFRPKHPVVLWLGLVLLTLPLQPLRDNYWYSMVVSRIPIFLTGMLFGRLEQTGFRRERLLEIGSLLAMVLGLGLIVWVYRGIGWTYGTSLGLWWYPYLFVIPGGAVLISWVGTLLRRYAWGLKLLHPFELLGRSSSEILMVHVGLYKIIRYFTKPSGWAWLLIFFGCLLLGVCYRLFVVEKLPKHT
jgi:peptidoglycan/LPS O-acetylase OafA/YrhL